MKIQKNDWYVLRKPILILSAVVFVVILFVSLIYQYDHHQTAALQQAQNTYNQTQQKLQLVQQDYADNLQYLPQYQHWLDTGFIGEESRHQWLTRLRQVREQHDLFEIDYDISQQQIYQPRFIEKTSHHRLYRSVMTLKLGLLHAGDLLHLLSGLRKNTSPFIVRNCEVLRIIDAPSDMLQENLKAQCEIDWLTLKEIF